MQNHCILKVSELPRRQTIIFLAFGRPQDRTETFAETLAETFAETFVGGAWEPSPGPSRVVTERPR